MKQGGFFEKVYQITKQIPYGRVTSYGAIANYLGTPRSARMVGWALNNSNLDDTIPAHRVVNRKGILTGKHHFSGSNLMEQLLVNEGVKVLDNQVLEFNTVFWNPIIELKLQ